MILFVVDITHSLASWFQIQGSRFNHSFEKTTPHCRGSLTHLLDTAQYDRVGTALTTLCMPDKALNIESQAAKDWRDVFGDETAFVLADSPASPVD